MKMKEIFRRLLEKKEKREVNNFKVIRGTALSPIFSRPEYGRSLPSRELSGSDSICVAPNSRQGWCRDAHFRSSTTKLKFNNASKSAALKSSDRLSMQRSRQINAMDVAPTETSYLATALCQLLWKDQTFSPRFEIARPLS
jgi:hypothetical protein